MKGRPTYGIIQIDDKLVAEDVIKEHFICDLPTCKGICCVKGDSGAPLEDHETSIVEEIYLQVRPFMREEGRKTVEHLGAWVIDADGDRVTPLIEGKECAFTFIEGGIYKCAFEKAWMEGITSFQKPISCHLYPIRVKKLTDFHAINYDRWEICKPATILGKRENVNVFRFLKDSLIRRYGEDFYQRLEKIASHLEE